MKFQQVVAAVWKKAANICSVDGDSVAFKGVVLCSAWYMQMWTMQQRTARWHAGDIMMNRSWHWQGQQFLDFNLEGGVAPAYRAMECNATVVLRIRLVSKYKKGTDASKIRDTCSA